jgi:hypothetical protein
MISDLVNNPIDPSAISFIAYRTMEAEAFPHDIYMMLIQSLRDSDKAEGGELILRWLAAAQSEFEDTYERVQTLRLLYDVEHTTLAALKHVKWLVGLTSTLDYLTGNLTEAELRRLVAMAVRTWKRKGTEAGLQEVLEAVMVGEVRIVNYFLFRVLVDSAELGFEEIPDVDPWLIDAPGMEVSIPPDEVTVVGPGLIHFSVNGLLGSGEAVPHRVRVTCLTTRGVVATLTSYWDPLTLENKVSTPSVALGLAPGGEPLFENSYRVGVDPDEYCSDLRVPDNGDLNRELVENLTRVLRSANERIFIRYVTFLDSFRRTFDWTVVSGEATSDQDAGEVQLLSGVEDSVIRVDRDNSGTWVNYYALARFRLGMNVVGRWGEFRFYHQDASNFYALRLTATGGVGATVTVDRVLAGARTSLLTVPLPVFHFDLNYTFAVDVTPVSGGGNLIQAELDGKHLGEVTDSALVSGCLELAAGTSQRLTATYVEMFRHPLESVRIGPEMSIGIYGTGGGPS